MRRGLESGQGPGATAPAAATARAPGTSRRGGASGGTPGPRSRRPRAPGPRAHGSVGTGGPRAACCHLPSCGSKRSRGRLKCPLPARSLRCGCCVRKRLWVFSGPCITDGNYRRLFLLFGSIQRKKLETSFESGLPFGVWGLRNEREQWWCKM